ncbi:MAG: hypothetical protein BGN96_01675 [Bacteroidales bacterium 45-6]|nr:MAG: hypothetical protein BGN96_01675 [Bacteroidales bacterium 45-6]
MITTVYPTIHNNALKLCFSNGKERKFKSLREFLNGNFSNAEILSFWSSATKRFNPTSPNAKENNTIVFSLIDEYEAKILANPSITPTQLANPDKVGSFELFILDHIEKEKKKAGGNFNNYVKLYKRLSEFHRYINAHANSPELAKFSNKLLKKSLSEMDIQDIGKEYGQLFNWWLANVYCTNFEKLAKCLNHILREIEKSDLPWSMSQMEGYSITANAHKPNKIEESPFALMPHEIETFLNWDASTYMGGVDADRAQIYHDFFCFMLECPMRSIDVMKLNYSQIGLHINGYIQVKYLPTKKQNQATKKMVSVPLSDRALAIVERYKGVSPDGYVFPLLSVDKIGNWNAGGKGVEKAASKVNQQMNLFIKQIAKQMGIRDNDGQISMYDLRHTSISYLMTVKKLDTVSLSLIADCSLDVMRKHYVNAQMAGNQMGFVSYTKKQNQAI